MPVFSFRYLATGIQRLGRSTSSWKWRAQLLPKNFFVLRRWLVISALTCPKPGSLNLKLSLWEFH